MDPDQASLASPIITRAGECSEKQDSRWIQSWKIEGVNVIFKGVQFVIREDKISVNVHTYSTTTCIYFALYNVHV